MGVASAIQEPAENLFVDEAIDQEDDPATLTVADLRDALLGATGVSDIGPVPSTNDSDDEVDSSDDKDESDGDDHPLNAAEAIGSLFREAHLVI
ncbi:hypothetical protein RhiJN_18487 [Ceratobasidium sp. AG-Ba]|nr:hypothetical protein RhiJN_18487 [Ceratobasidium sp. AG-Ba]